MALKACKECGHQVSKNAAACPSCGNPIKKKNKRTEIGCGGLFALVILAIIFSSMWDTVKQNKYGKPAVKKAAIPAKPEPTPGQLLTPDIKQAMQRLEREGGIKMDPSTVTVYVDPVMWASSKYEDKKKLGWAFAVYMATLRGNNIIRTDIKDMYSGRKLASYSQVWGFDVED